MFKSYRTWLAVGLLAAAPIAVAQTAFQDGEFKPYEELSVYEDGLTRSVDSRVLYFAHFTCPFCRQAHGYLMEWGNALPPPYELEVVPAVGINEHIPMAVAYYVVVKARPDRLRQFEAALYTALQDRGGDQMEPATYEKAAVAAGISKDTFRRLAGSDEVRGYVFRAKALTERYGVSEVPTVVIANRFKTAPGRVQNQQEAFVSILNGLISMDFRERYER